MDLNDIRELERQHESIFIDTVEFGITLKNFKGDHINTKAFIYKRVNDDFSPKMHVWYHFHTVSDELVAITYNWGFYNPSFDPDKHRNLLFATSKREKQYRKKYDSLNQFLNEEIGPHSEINLIVDNENSFNEMFYWENDLLYAYSRMRFQRKIIEIPGLGLVNNHFVVQLVISFKDNE